MKIGFLSNQLDIRGTGNALYNYAHYNEEILGNKSAIITLNNGPSDTQVIEKFKKRFGVIYGGWEFSTARFYDVLYHIKSGHDDGIRPPILEIPYLVHSVFENHPHGDRYATISPWMGKRFNLPFVPHIVSVTDDKTNLRDELGIPEDAVVFGRHGGADSFDIPFVWETINKAQLIHPQLYFVFMNTNIPDINLSNSNRIKFLESTADDIRKKQFINTCDAMIHARARGETFGIAVGEFAITGKPVMTYAASPEIAHLQELGNFAFLYHDEHSLMLQFDSLIRRPALSWGYGQYTPENVMKKFNEVFLS